MSEYTRFACECRGPGVPLPEFDAFAELNQYRRKLLQLGLIGMNANGIGFGNVSVRNGATNNFYITGSGTGGMAELSPADCAKVVSYSFEKNWLQYEGSAIPSSESLTHAAVYQSDANAGAVIHCHDLRLWKALLHEAPATSAAVEYGTPEIAYEVMRLFEKTNVRSGKIVVMTGHEGGLIAFGKDLEQAFTVIIRSAKTSSSRGDVNGTSGIPLLQQ